MIRSGLTAMRATTPFRGGGKRYPAGSYVFTTAPAYRPHLLDVFDPQDHPNDFGFNFTAVTAKPSRATCKLTKARIGTFTFLFNSIFYTAVLRESSTPPGRRPSATCRTQSDILKGESR